MHISFGDGSDAATVARTIPHGHTVSLLKVGQEVNVTGDHVLGTEVWFEGASELGVHYRNLDKDGQLMEDGMKFLPWIEVDRIHVH